MVRGMRLNVLAVLLVCFCLAIADPRVYRRQNNGDAAASTTRVASTSTLKGSTTGTFAPSSTEESETESTTTTTTTISSSTTSSTSTSTTAEVSPVYSNINGPVETTSYRNSNYSYAATPDALPLNPEVTPAFAIGGILLVLTGSAYTLIGIKNQLVHTFLSAAYLGAVSVTVLILYVMNLPISNSIQGAYLVAATVTGLILGGGSIMFAEMTEGLGCLLGGFCFSMWLLVLTPGGLLQSSEMVILIVVLTLAAFGTAFSHYTRNYGLLVGVSFGGATAVVLGIDCFTRAGLKEFWAYIWNLNTNLFPLGATSYPVTKGMKVEIATIIVIFFIGIISQLKVWELIRERREHREDEGLREDRVTGLAQAEETVARRIADRIVRQRTQWEAVYGDKDATVSSPTRSKRDSGIADVESQKKGGRSASLRRSGEDHIEMVPMPSPSTVMGAGLVMKGQEGGPVTVRVASDASPSTQLEVDAESTGSPVKGEPHIDQEEQTWVGADGLPKSLRISSKQVIIPGSEAPKVVPLPFQVPQSEAGDDDGSSVATFADEDRELNRNSKHLSAGSAMLRKLSKISQRSSQRFSRGVGDSSEDLVIPRAVDIDDDRASSIAATVDGLSDDEDMRSTRSSINEPLNTEGGINPVTDIPEIRTLTTGDPTIIPFAAELAAKKPRPVSEATVATNILDIESSTRHDVPPIQQFLPLITDLATTSQTSTLAKEDKGKAVEKEDFQPGDSVVESKANITKDSLPARLSKVVTSYRTNEWAKHLEAAENPELDELELAEYSNEPDHRPAEVAAPVDLAALQQSSEISSRPASRSPNQSSSRPPLSKNALRSQHSLHQPTLDTANVQRQDSSISPSTSQRTSNRKIVRSSSISTNQTPIAESPIEEDLGNSVKPNSGPVGKRDSTVRAKQPYYSNGAALASTPEFRRGSRSGSESRDVYVYPNNSTPAIVDHDSVSLAARRSVIRQSSLQTMPLAFNSHQPKRQSSTPTPMAREQQLASWRASVSQDLQNAQVPKHNIERSRSALFNERQAEEQRRAMEMMKKAKRESAFDDRMRRGDMHEAHRDAMRKMQAKANKAVS